MSIQSGLSRFVSEHLVEPFVKKPGMHLPAETAERLLTVQENVNGRMAVDHFVQSSEDIKRLGDGARLDMMPSVPGGFREGDIVLRGNSVATTAESGLVTTLTEGLTKGDWHVHPSAVSHSGIVARNDKGELRVVQMVSGDTPPELASKLTPLQKKMKATFLREDSLEDFFNAKPGENPYTQSTVMRPQDPELGRQAAERANEYLKTQVTPEGTHPWYSKLPHSLAPDDRGGVCSTFVNLAYGDHFDQVLHLPTTPEHFVIAPDLTKVGDKSITDIQASGRAFPAGQLTVRTP